MTSEEIFPLEGGCTCGSVRYRLLRKPMFVHGCHCTYCQRESGSAFAVNALIEASQFQVLSGDIDGIEIPTLSGKGQNVFRCNRCLLAIWSHYAAAGSAVNFVRVGTLDNPNHCPPDIHIYTSTRQQWVILPEGVLAVNEYYRASQYWPGESLARYKAAVYK